MAGEEFLDALPALDDLANQVVVTVSSEDGALRMAGTFMGGGTRIGLRNENLTPDEIVRSVVTEDPSSPFDLGPKPSGSLPDQAGVSGPTSRSQGWENQNHDPSLS